MSLEEASARRHLDLTAELASKLAELEAARLKFEVDARLSLKEMEVMFKCELLEARSEVLARCDEITRTVDAPPADPQRPLAEAKAAAGDRGSGGDAPVTQVSPLRSLQRDQLMDVRKALDQMRSFATMVSRLLELETKAREKAVSRLSSRVDGIGNDIRRLSSAIMDQLLSRGDDAVSAIEPRVSQVESNVLQLRDYVTQELESVYSHVQMVHDSLHDTQVDLVKSSESKLAELDYKITELAVELAESELPQADAPAAVRP